MDDNFGGWMKILSFVFLLTFYALAQFGGNSAPRWGGNSAPAWGGNPAASAPAYDCVVENTNDAGAGSLRECIANASPGDTVGFDESLAGMEIVIDSALVIDKDLSIFGFGTNHVIISADSGSRVIEITGSGDNVVLRGLRITKGAFLRAENLQGGAGIYSLSSVSIVVDSCIIDSCFAERQSGIGQSVYGAGLFFNSLSTSLQISNSIIADNTVSHPAGGASSANGGGIAVFNSSATVLIERTAIIRNKANATGTNSANGGGAYTSSTGPVTYRNCTISGNQATRTGGGGLTTASANSVIDFCTISGNSITGGVTGTGGWVPGGATDTLRNSIISGNTSPVASPDVGGTVTYVAETCIGNDANMTITTDGGGNLLDTDPGLGTLTFTNNTWVHPIDSGDPVYNTGNCTIGTGGDVDQRGISRPQSTECDMGAYEVE